MDGVSLRPTPPNETLTLRGEAHCSGAPIPRVVGPDHEPAMDERLEQATGGRDGPPNDRRHVAHAGAGVLSDMYERDKLRQGDVSLEQRTQRCAAERAWPFLRVCHAAIVQ